MKSLLILLLGFTSITVSLQSFFTEKKQTLSGIVFETGKETSLTGVKVTVYTNGKSIATAKTKTDGSYILALNEGHYEVEYALNGYETNRALNVVISKGKNEICDAHLLPSMLPGQSVSWEWSGRSHTNRVFDAPSTKGRASAAPRGAAAKGKSATAPPPPMAEPMIMEDREAAYEMAAPAVAVATGDAVKLAKTEDRMAKPYLIDGIPVHMDKKDSPRPSSAPSPRAGLLTAGEWNDLDNWATHWTDLLNDGEIDAHQNTYGFFPRHRYCVLLTNNDDFPVIDAQLTLTNAKGEILWEARTDNTGKAELWYGLHDKSAQATELSVFATIDGKKQTLGKVKPIAEGISRFRLNRSCQSSQKVDIVWAVDATGSMGDEIEYLKTELLDVIGRVKTINPTLAMRMGTVFYRDITDDYVVKSSGLSPDISKTVDYIRQQYAGGGGDYPEAVHSALEEAIYRQDWSTDAVARICFLVLDASPHQTPDINASIQRSIREAARKGIRIVPVSASGIQKDTEFLMKFFGLATNGTYLFLTDHSGIGGKHIEATTDEYKVELLNNLLVRIISQYTSVASCDGKSQVVFENPMPDNNQQQAATNQTATYYPNPAVSYVTLDLPFDAQKVTLYNAEGKAVYSLAQTTTGRYTIPVQDLPGGYYSLRIWKDNQTQSGKILVIKT